MSDVIFSIYYSFDRFSKSLKQILEDVFLEGTLSKAFPRTQCSLKARKHKNRKPIVHGIPILYCNETEAQFLHLI